MGNAQSRVRLCAVNGKLIAGSVHPRPAVNFLQLFSEQFLRRYRAFGDPVDSTEIFDVDSLSVNPLRDASLSYTKRSSQLLLRPDEINGFLNCAHEPQISGAYSDSQQRRLWRPSRASISVPNMPSDPHKKAKMASADKEAHKRLRAIWDGFTPKKDRPKQEAIAEDLGSQSVVSQYLTGRIPINYYAAKVFAKHLKCKDTDIRSDLPEQQIVAKASDSSVSEGEVDQMWSTMTTAQKMLAIGLHQAFTQQFTAPQQEEQKDEPKDRHRTRRSG